MQKSKIILLISSGFAFRNYIPSGFLKELSKISDVKILFPEEFKESILNFKNLDEKIDFIPKIDFPKSLIFLNGILSKATNKRLAIQDEYFKKWYISISKGYKKLFVFFQYFLANLFAKGKIYGLMRKIEIKKFEDFLKNNNFFNNIKADLIISTQPYKLSESALINCSNKNCIPNVGIIISWDNLLWMGHMVSKPLYFFLWGKEMKEDLKRHYENLEDDKIFETSSPQFDFHLMDEFIFEKKKFYSLYNLDLNKKIILYASNVAEHFLYEPLLIESILRRFSIEKELKDYVLFLRIHPHDNTNRFDFLKEKYFNLIIQKPFKKSFDIKTWFIPEEEELKLFSSTLKYSDIVINMASSVTLDAAYFDKPVINIAFSPKNDKFSFRIPHYYESQHYKKVIKYNAVDLVYCEEELFNSIKKYIKKPEIKRDERKKMIENICGFNGKISIYRTLEAIEKILKRG